MRVRDRVAYYIATRFIFQISHDSPGVEHDGVWFARHLEFALLLSIGHQGLEQTLALELAAHAMHIFPSNGSENDFVCVFVHDDLNARTFFNTELLTNGGRD